MRILFLLLIPFSLFADESTRLSLNSLALKAKTPLVTCPQRVWPGFEPLKNSSYVLVEPSTNKSVSISGKGDITEGTAEEWGEEGSGPYAFSKKNNQDMILINIEYWESDSEILETLFHEGFHHVGQEAISYEEINRNEIMPVDYEGRLAKAMQLRHMKQAIKEYSTSSKSINLAKYWENWIEKNRPKDWKFNQAWDVREGSAEYVGKRSHALTELGCEASESELADFMIKSLEDDSETKERIGQSYKSGLLGYIMAALENNLEVFENLNQSPLSLMLEDCEETSDEIDPQLKESYELQFSFVSDIVEKSVGDFTMSDGVIVVPGSSMAGAFSAMGFYAVKDLEILTALPNFKASFEVNGSLIVAQNAATFMADEARLCSLDNSFIFPVQGTPEAGKTYGGIKLPENLKFTQESEFLGKKVWCLKN